MSTISNSCGFDWNAYEKKLLTNENPTFTQTSTYMRAIGAAMLVSASILFHHARTLTSTPILTYSVIAIISVVAIKIILNKSYKDLTVHRFVDGLRAHIDEMVSKKKGLLQCGYENQKDVIWAHIKHHELTFSYKNVIARNGDIGPLLTVNERNTLGLKYLEEITPYGLSKEFQKAYDGAKAFNLEDEFRNNPNVQTYVRNFVNGFDFENSSSEHYLFLLRNSFISPPRALLVSTTSNMLVAEEKGMKEKINNRNETLSHHSNKYYTACTKKRGALEIQRIEAHDQLNLSNAQLKALEEQLPQNRLEKARAELVDLEKKLKEYEAHKQNPDAFKERAKNNLISVIGKARSDSTVNFVDVGFDGIRNAGNYLRSLPKLIADTTQSIEEKRSLVSRLEIEVNESPQNNESQALKDQISTTTKKIAELNVQINRLEIYLNDSLSKFKKEASEDIALIRNNYKKETMEIIATYQAEVKQIS